MAAVIINGGAAAAVAAERGFADFARDLIDLEKLSCVDFTSVRMTSTWDRTGGNRDNFHAGYLNDGVYAFADFNGPGVVRRIYSAKPGGWLRIFIDDNPRPVVDMDCAEFFSGRHSPFVRPVVGPMGGANYCYFPFAYSKSIRIQTTALADKPDDYGSYYQVTYETFPEGTRITPTQIPLLTADEQVWRQVIETWKNVGQDPKPSSSRQTTVTKEVRIRPGYSATLADLTGPAVIDRIHIKLQDPTQQLLRSTLLRIWWDEEETLGVDCPLGDFFGNAFSQVPYKSLPMGLVDGEYYCYFSMPFNSRARIVVLNESLESPVIITSRVVYHKTDGMRQDQGYFHAKWRRESVAAVDLKNANLDARYNYTILDVKGKGRYIGTSLNVFSRELNWWGEGDPMIFVDGERWPPTFPGTGTEEYFNDAWGFNQYTRAVGADPDKKERSVVPVSGVLLPGLDSPNGCFAGNAVFSFHLSDSIPFMERILVTIEHGTENNMSNDYSSVAYWYVRPNSRDFFFMRPVLERATVPIEEWEDVRKEALRVYGLELRRILTDAAASVRNHPTDARHYGWRRQVLGRLTRLGEAVGLTAEERAEIRERWLGSREGGTQSEWAKVDQLIIELADRLALEEE